MPVAGKEQLIQYHDETWGQPQCGEKTMNLNTAANTQAYSDSKLR